jgi:hypothetical protein
MTGVTSAPSSRAEFAAVQSIREIAMLRHIQIVANFFVATLFVATPLVATAQARTAAPAGAEVYFISPADGDTVSSPVTVKFGLKGMGVAPAGIQVANTGHHHVLIDTPVPANLSAPIPADDAHKHFGAGQTETTIELKPGKHTLQLLLGDALHTPHDPPVQSAVITITVK